MAKKESTFTSMVLTLFLVTLGASGALGYVFELTKGAISEAESAKKNLAITRVLPEFNNKPNEEFMKVPIGGGDSLIFYIGKMDEDTVGYAIESYSNSAFAGYLGVLAGFTPEGKISSIAVLEHKETPGLGTKMLESPFKDQFPGKNPGDMNMKVTKDGGEIDAITASTITSRAYCEAVQRAYDALQQQKGGNQ